MKGFLTASLIFLILLSSLFLYNKYMTETMISLSDYAATIEESINEENFKKANFILDSFEKKLNEKAYFLYFVTDRTLLDNTLTECARLKSFLSIPDKAESLAAVSGINIMIKKTLEKSTIPLTTKQSQ